MEAKKSKINGGVIIIGSLFWENDKNCLQKSIRLAKERMKWRNDNLNTDDKQTIPLPIRYGRCSSSRLCTYTMVLSNDFINKGGKGIIIPFKDEIDFSKYEVFREQIEYLARVEGISNNKFVCSWGAVAIWLNENSNYNGEIQKKWNTIIESGFGYEKNIEDFNWNGTLLKERYQLDLSISTEFDFLLCTYILPKHKNIQKNNLKEYPTPKEIAVEMLTSGYQTYFCQNRASSIITCDDDAIISYLVGK